MEDREFCIRTETQRIERETLSPYAALSENTRGRERETAACPIRTPYQRDRDKAVSYTHLYPALEAILNCKNPTQTVVTVLADKEAVSYTHLDDPDPDAAGKDYLSCMNPNSLEVLTGCKVEKSLENAKAPASFQFMRQGYFCVDNKDSAEGHLVFNRSVSLKDGFKK